MTICKYEAARGFCVFLASIWLVFFSFTGFDIFITLFGVCILINSIIGIIERTIDLQEGGEKNLYVRNEDLPTVKESIEQLESLHKTKAI